jgi:zinc protease
MARLSRLLMIALLLAAAGCAREERPAPQLRHLPNGLTVIAKENRAADVVSVQVWVRDGAVYEAPGDAGTANLLSKAIFSASTTRAAGEMSRAIESVGGFIASDHNQDHVCFEVTVPGRHFDLALDVLSDAVLRPVFDAAEVERAKMAIVKQAAALVERPTDRALQLCLQTIMPGHPMSRPPASAMFALKSLDAAALEAWRASRYVGANMVVVVVGSVDPSEAADKVERAFSSVPSGTRAQPWAPSITWPTSPSRVMERTDGKRATMMIAFPGPGVADEDHIAADVLMMALANGRSSPISRVLVEERGLAGSVGGGWYTRTQPSPCFVWMDLSPENVQAAEDAVIEVIASLAEKPLAAEDLARGKALLKAYMVFASETAEQQAAYDGYWFVVAEEGYGDTYLDRIDAVTVEDLRAAVAKYLRPQARVTAVLEPAWVR